MPKNYVAKHIKRFGQSVNCPDLCIANLKQSFLPQKLYLLETHKKELREQFLFILSTNIGDIFRVKPKYRCINIINVDGENSRRLSLYETPPLRSWVGKWAKYHTKGRRPFPCISNLYIDWEVSSTLIAGGEFHSPANFVRPGLRQSNALRAFFSNAP